MADLYSNIKRAANIDYMSRDFDSLRSRLSDYIKQNFPDSFSDFTDQSAGMALLETVCYAGDILNFYLDRQFNELFLTTAQEEKNVVALARNLGYKIRGNSAAQNNNIILTFNYPTSGSISNYGFILKAGSRFSNDAGDSIHEMIYDLDTTTITSSTTSQDIVNNVTSATISGIQVIAGVTKTYQVKIGAPISFMRIPIPDPNVLEILSVTSSDGNTWYEVDYLSQENQMIGLMNQQSTSAAVPFVLTLRRVPRRFVVERSTSGSTALRFGSGVLSTTDAEFIPNPEDFIIPFSLRGSVSGFSPANVDPSDFVNTGTLGAAPAFVTLTIKYRAGGGLATNATANTIKNIINKQIQYKTTGNAFQKSLLEASMQVNNPEPSTGGEDSETLDQIKLNAAGFFATQNRCVTLQDYIVRSYTLPTQFGSVFRATASRDLQDTSHLGIRLATLSRNADGSLTTSSVAMKINLVNYLNQFRSLSENITVADARIINIGLRFGVVTDMTSNQQEILANCVIALQNFFDIRLWNLGQSISTSLVDRALTDINGVLAVPVLQFFQFPPGFGGRNYSNSQMFYNIDARTRNRVIMCDADQIFEIKYPNFDITGSILT
jgi:hypothetical protein